MMEIRVRPSGALDVIDYRLDGNCHRTREFASWERLLSEWGPRWSIDIRRTVWVRLQLRPVIIEDNGRLVMRVDPRTRKVTNEPQQFYMQPDERGYSLQILDRADWVDEPHLVKVDSLYGNGNHSA